MLNAYEGSLSSRVGMAPHMDYSTLIDPEMGALHSATRAITVSLFCVGGEAVHGADGTGGAGAETGGGGEADMIVTALEQRKTHGELYKRWQSLSPREQEVTALTCQG